jgi:hypothetical protein
MVVRLFELLAESLRTGMGPSRRAIEHIDKQVLGAVAAAFGRVVPIAKKERRSKPPAMLNRVPPRGSGADRWVLWLDSGRARIRIVWTKRESSYLSFLGMP